MGDTGMDVYIGRRNAHGQYESDDESTQPLHESDSDEDDDTEGLNLFHRAWLWFFSWFSWGGGDDGRVDQDAAAGPGDIAKLSDFDDRSPYRALLTTSYLKPPNSLFFRQ